MCCGKRILKRHVQQRTKNEVWKKSSSLKNPWKRMMTLKEFMDRFRGIFSRKLWRFLFLSFFFFFFVNKYKIEEDTPNWCCRRTLLLNLLGRVIVRKYVTFLRRHLLASKLNLSKRITVSALAVFLAVLKVLLTQLTGIPRCTESLVKTDRGWDLNKTSLVTRFLSEPHKNPK